MMTSVKSSRLMSENDATSSDEDHPHQQKRMIKRRKKYNYCNQAKQSKQRDSIFHGVNIVLDLDETLINSLQQPFYKLNEFLKQIRNLATTLILWTAGNEIHAEAFLKELESTGQSNIFDHILTELKEERKPVMFLVREYNLSIDMPFLLLDDNRLMLESGYDIPIDVTRFYKNQGSVTYYVDYDAVLETINTEVSKWHEQERNIRKNMSKASFSEGVDNVLPCCSKTFHISQNNPTKNSQYNIVNVKRLLSDNETDSD